MVIRHVRRLLSIPSLSLPRSHQPHHFPHSTLSSIAFIDRYTRCSLKLRIIRSIMKGFLALSLLPLLASASPVLVDTIHNEAAPILSSTLAQEIPDSYIVVFKKEVSHASACAHHDWVHEQHVQIETAKMDLAKRSQFPLTAFGGLKHTFNFAGSLLGYSGHFDESVIEQVRRHPDVSPRATSLISLSMYPFSHVTILKHGFETGRLH